MEDLISRQQTITALRALSDEDGYINAPHEVVTDVVRGLPPVQAEQEQTTHSERGETDKLGVKASETCEDCISRQAAIDACIRVQEHHAYDEIEEIKALPPAKPERKTGKWIMKYKGSAVTSYKCSECGRIVRDDTGYDVSKDYPFCHCGADMREGQDG